MKFKKIVVSVILLSGFGLCKLQAQDVVPATGSTASGSGGTVSYSVGQVVYTSNSGSNGSVAQGVQQPYEISVVIGLADAVDISLSFSVYPNPTTDFLKLNTGNYKSQNLLYQLSDMNGKILESKKTQPVETTISMLNNASGIYFLKVMDNNNELKTFKIIKN
ncbi:MAG: T9SS type A sorting domain-containing protein [Bacteroidota bacterium]|nr:T9SS type A sorting domain-containing protein [Bacteroidota bacterium]